MKLNRQAFTLLEVMAVVAIIAILAGLGAKGYSLACRQAKESRAKAEIENLRIVLNKYRIEQGYYPSDLGFLSNVVEDIEMIDPWGRDYHYFCSNRFLYSIWSDGQDPNRLEDDVDPTKSGY